MVFNGSSDAFHDFIAFVAYVYHERFFAVNDYLRYALSLSYRNLYEKKKRMDIFETGRLFYHLHFNKIGGSWNADGDSGDDDDLLSFWGHS